MRSNASLVELPTLDEVRQEKARRSLAAFSNLVFPDYVIANHQHLLIEKLEAVERGDIRNLMVFMPPGSAKSTYVSVLFPAWYLGRNPTKSVIAASYGQRLSARFGKKCRGIVGGPAFRSVFGHGLASDATAKDEWETERGGEFSATSVDGAVTGRRGDALLVDDPVKGRKEADSKIIRDVAWEWWVSDFRPRMKPHGAKVIVETRWHEDDIPGRILPADYHGETGVFISRDGEEWHVISIRAEAEADDILGRAPGEFLWPEWFPAGMLAQEKISQRSRNWAALYQQRPAPEEGDYFKREWLRWYDTAPPLNTLVMYGASDYAVTADGGDWTVHGVIGVDPDDNIFVLDWWRGQTDSDVWIEQWLNLARAWRPREWGEESGQIAKSIGPFIEKRIRESHIYCYRQQYPSAADKATRAQTFRARMAMGKVLFPRNATWVDTLVNEMLVFPAGTNDDQVDVLGLFGRMLNRMSKGREPGPPKPNPLDGGLPTFDDLMEDAERRRERF